MIVIAIIGIFAAIAIPQFTAYRTMGYREKGGNNRTGHVGEFNFLSCKSQMLLNNSPLKTYLYRGLPPSSELTRLKFGID
jgi:hypothetical protein